MVIHLLQTTVKLKSTVLLGTLFSGTLFEALVIEVHCDLIPRLFLSPSFQVFSSWAEALPQGIVLQEKYTENNLSSCTFELVLNLYSHLTYTSDRCGIRRSKLFALDTLKTVLCLLMESVAEEKAKVFPSLFYSLVGNNVLPFLCFIIL